MNYPPKILQANVEARACFFGTGRPLRTSFIAGPSAATKSVFQLFDRTVVPLKSQVVFSLNDTYSFGVLQSFPFWHWWIVHAPNMYNVFRFQIESVFHTFAWPQSPTTEQISNIEIAAKTLTKIRRKLCQQHWCTVDELYLKDCPLLVQAQRYLDNAVYAAYGIDVDDPDVLGELYELNEELARREAMGLDVVGPGPAL